MSGEWNQSSQPPQPVPPPLPPTYASAPGYPPPLPPGYAAPPPPPGSGSGGGPKWLVVAAIVVVVAIGVGATVVLTSGDDGPELPPPDLELDELQPALVTADDLGDDWEEVEDAERSEPPDQQEVSDECRRTTEERGDAVYQVSPSEFVVFRQASGVQPAILVHTISLVTEDTPSFADVREVAEVCTEATVDDGEETITTVQRVVDADGPGEDVLAFETETTVTVNDGDQQSSVTHSYQLLVLRDGVLSIVSIAGGIEDPGPPDEAAEGGPPDVDLVHQLAEETDERVRAVLNDQ